jgi:hypothetical protein
MQWERQLQNFQSGQAPDDTEVIFRINPTDGLPLLATHCQAMQLILWAITMHTASAIVLGLILTHN